MFLHHSGSFSDFAHQFISVIRKAIIQGAQFMGPDICSTIFCNTPVVQTSTRGAQSYSGDGERKRQFWPLEPQGVCNFKGRQNGSLISLRMVAPLPPPSLFLLTTIDACFSETNHWWHLTYAVKKRKERWKEDRRMLQGKHHWNTEFDCPFYTSLWFLSWSQSANTREIMAMLFRGVWQSWVLDLDLQGSGQVLWFWKGSDLSLGPA